MLAMFQNMKTEECKPLLFFTVWQYWRSKTKLFLYVPPPYLFLIDKKHVPNTGDGIQGRPKEDRNKILTLKAEGLGV